MAERVCPVWMGWWLASPVRKLFQNPEKILGPFIQPGMTVLEPGCAMGFFSLPAAKLAGPKGKVVCIDLQPGMIRQLSRRAAKAGTDRKNRNQGMQRDVFKDRRFKKYRGFCLCHCRGARSPGPGPFFQRNHRDLETQRQIIICRTQRPCHTRSVSAIPRQCSKKRPESAGTGQGVRRNHRDFAKIREEKPNVQIWNRFAWGWISS